jgi:hypothetical protein
MKLLTASRYHLSEHDAWAHLMRDELKTAIHSENLYPDVDTVSRGVPGPTDSQMWCPLDCLYSKSNKSCIVFGSHPSSCTTDSLNLADTFRLLIGLNFSLDSIFHWSLTLAWLTPDSILHESFTLLLHDSILHESLTLQWDLSLSGRTPYHWAMHYYRGSYHSLHTALRDSIHMIMLQSNHLGLFQRGKISNSDALVIKIQFWVQRSKCTIDFLPSKVYVCHLITDRVRIAI